MRPMRAFLYAIGCKACGTGETECRISTKGASALEGRHCQRACRLDRAGGLWRLAQQFAQSLRRVRDLSFEYRCRGTGLTEYLCEETAGATGQIKHALPGTGVYNSGACRHNLESQPGLGLGEKSPGQRHEFIELVLVNPMPGVFDAGHPGIFEVACPSITLRIGRPGLSAAYE